jgi:uncharacterized iron-regulated membrane protein
MSAAKWNRKLHRWGALITCLPVLVIFVTGFFLQMKKEWAWVQPPTEVGQSPDQVNLSWTEILEAAAAVPEAQISTWADVDRVDVRPDKGMLKVRSRNRWEVQLDASTGAVLSSNYRRSDLIESLHDGSWFHDQAKLWIWTPTALVLCGLWVTGVYLWLLPHLMRRRKKQRST